jgi:hypothetical protein
VEFAEAKGDQTCFFGGFFQVGEGFASGCSIVTIITAFGRAFAEVKFDSKVGGAGRKRGPLRRGAEAEASIVIVR